MTGCLYWYQITGHIVCATMLSLYILLSVVSGANRMIRTYDLHAAEGSVCGNSDEVYKKTSSRSQTECSMNCVSLPDCDHSIFRRDTQECYLEDENGMDTCDSDCRQFPCFPLPTEVRNVALGAVATCSSVYDPSWYNCSNAVDDIEDIVWASDGEGVGSWLRLDFGRHRILTGARFMQRYSYKEQYEELKLSFSDGSDQEIKLPYHPNYVWTWDDIQLAPVRTTWVIITAMTVHTTKNNGFAEVQLFARVRKDLATPDLFGGLSLADYRATHYIEQ